jgi:HKD family nuclease
MAQELLWKTQVALDKIKEIKGISKLFIAVAFIEPAGVDWIESLVSAHKIPKNRVEIFLSTSFSSRKPSILLERLTKIANVYIVSQKKLHAKVILAIDKNKRGKLMIGSANLTWSGINSNLEMTTVFSVDETSTIKYFFDHCRSLANIVDEDIIQKYRLLEPSLDNIPESDPIIEKITSQPFTANDPVIPDKSTLDNFYFTYEDYETLFPRNAVLNISEIKQRRKIIEQKMMSLHQRIKEFVNQLDLHEHWNDNHIVSTLSPSPFNHYSVSWVGIRYGKSRNQIERLNPGATTSDGNLYSFPKHGCIQIALYDNAFAVSFFHAVRYDSWDRAFVQNKLRNDPNYISTIISELEKLKGFGYKWYINDPVNDNTLDIFSIDDDPLDKFPEFYSKDSNGFESHLTKKWKPDSKELLNEETIVSALKEQIQLLKPLYTKMVQI